MRAPWFRTVSCWRFIHWQEWFDRMTVHEFLKRHGIVRSAICADILFFAVPGMTVLGLGLYF